VSHRQIFLVHLRFLFHAFNFSILSVDELEYILQSYAYFNLIKIVLYSMCEVICESSMEDLAIKWILIDDCQENIFSCRWN